MSCCAIISLQIYVNKQFDFCNFNERLKRMCIVQWQNDSILILFIDFGQILSYEIFNI